MTQVVAKYAAKKLLSKEMKKYKDKNVTTNDPYYVIIDHPRKPGKTKKVKKQIPAYIPPHDAEILAQARRRAYMLDVCLFNFMGIRFGWSSVIGIIPAAGDALDGLLAWQLVRKMSDVECGLGDKRKWMYLWILFDILIGLVPFVGDLLDAGIKCNSKNVALLERRLDEVYKPKTRNGEETNTPKDHKNNPLAATVFEDFSEEEAESRDHSPYGDNRRHEGIAPPKPARVPSASRGEAPQQMSSNGRGLFSSGGRRERQPDPEMGIPRGGDTHQPGRSGTRGSRR